MGSTKLLSLVPSKDIVQKENPKLYRNSNIFYVLESRIGYFLSAWHSRKDLGTNNRMEETGKRPIKILPMLRDQNILSK